MAINIKTSDPTKLLKKIYELVKEGAIVTWSVDEDGDFTHDTDQWKHKAWLVPSKSEGKLSFYILGPKEEDVSTRVYGIYHGRFIEMLLCNVDGEFEKAEASSMPEGRDRVSVSE